MDSNAWIGGGAGGYGTWKADSGPGRTRVSQSRVLRWGQVLGALAGGPGFFVFLHFIGFWGNPEHPLFMKALTGVIPALFSVALFGFFRPPVLEFDFAKGEIRLYLFPVLKRRIARDEVESMTLREIHRSDSSFDLPHRTLVSAELGLTMKGGEELALVESHDRSRLLDLGADLSSRLKLPFDPGHEP